MFLVGSTDILVPTVLHAGLESAKGFSMWVSFINATEL